MTEINYQIEGDSGEYEFLTEAVGISRNVTGMCIEIGLRRGLGTKTIIDAVRRYSPDKTVIAVDPYGSILYQGREHTEPCRLDYTNQMKAETLAALWAYIAENPVDFKFYNWTDEFYFNKMADGEVIYDSTPDFKKYFSMVHLDGPHSVDVISKELDFFIPRMFPGAVIVFDDITPDFYPHRIIQDNYSSGFNIIKTGFKKEIWQLR